MISLSIASSILLSLTLRSSEKYAVTAAAAAGRTTHSDNNRVFISSEQNSELVTLPRRELLHRPNVIQRSLRRSLQSCPHLENGLLDWHDASTWTSVGLPGIPSAGSDVTLPSNSKVVIRQTVEEVLGVITIPEGSELILGEHDQNDDIELDVEGMDVRGTLRAGSETCRLDDQPITITLHGSRPSDAVTNPKPLTYKGIVVSGDNALLELHGGGSLGPTWTRLASTAEIGDDQLLLQDVVGAGWAVGSEVLITTTAFKDSREWHQNEVFTISSVESVGDHGGSIVSIDGTMTYTHTANSGYQAEVGLLTRTLKIQGSPTDSEPTDPDPLTCTGRNLQGNTGTHCPETELTGFGGHVRIQNSGTAHVEGVELYRMGQTNVLGRYPMHFHLLEDQCPTCYFRESSVHRSFYRCVSIHATHDITVADNVAHDVVGFCYYLEDGIEERNKIVGNLASHVHWMGPQVWGAGQTIDVVTQSDILTLPADVTASGFYITNVHNEIVGNAASGGWAGFAFPVLHSPIGPSKDINMRPSSRVSLEFRGNTAHSSGWWWYHSGAFYLGGSLYYQGDKLKYNAGRDQNMGNRSPCYKDHCVDSNNCDAFCQPEDQAWNLLQHNKAFLTAGPAMNSWSGRADIVGFEVHDVGLALEALESGFYIQDLLSVCRSGTALSEFFPPGSGASKISGDGFFWYDTNQEHIINHGTFRNCGYRGNYDEYDASPTRGCGDDDDTGCRDDSTVFGFLTHSDQFTPELMQATRDITFDDCGRRYLLDDFRNDNTPSTVSGRGQNWLDVDGTASGGVLGVGEPILIGSGLADAGKWWLVDDEVFQDTHAPLIFMKQSSGPERGLGHIKLLWDDSLHNQVGGSLCGNGNNAPCPAVGSMKHFGPRFQNSPGLPITANADIVGPVGGYGWMMELDDGAPRNLRIELIEVMPDTPMLLGIKYPPGTGVTIVANAAWCSPHNSYSCQETFHSVNSIEEVRSSLGNAYYLSSDGLMVVRIIMSPQTFTGTPDWIKPDFETIGKWNKGYALDRFERDGILLPKMSYGPWIDVTANCSGGAYCSASQDAAAAVAADDLVDVGASLVDGFCNWGPNGDADSSTCEGGAQGGEWCNANQSQCEQCGGRWCTEDDAPVPAPVPAPVAGPPTAPQPGTFIEVCPSDDYEQVAYDKCCSATTGICEFADGSTTNNDNDPTTSPSVTPSASPVTGPGESTSFPSTPPTATPSMAPTLSPVTGPDLPKVYIHAVQTGSSAHKSGTKWKPKLAFTIKSVTTKEKVKNFELNIRMLYGNTNVVKKCVSNKSGKCKVKKLKTVPNSYDRVTIEFESANGENGVIKNTDGEGVVYDASENENYDGCQVFSEICPTFFVMGPEATGTVLTDDQAVNDDGNVLSDDQIIVIDDGNVISDDRTASDDKNVFQSCPRPSSTTRPETSNCVLESSSLKCGDESCLYENECVAESAGFSVQDDCCPVCEEYCMSMYEPVECVSATNAANKCSYSNPCEAMCVGFIGSEANTLSELCAATTETRPESVP